MIKDKRNTFDKHGNNLIHLENKLKVKWDKFA